MNLCCNNLLYLVCVYIYIKRMEVERKSDLQSSPEVYNSGPLANSFNLQILLVYYLL